MNFVISSIKEDITTMNPTLFAYTMINASITNNLVVDESNKKRMLKLSLRSNNHSKNIKCYKKLNKDNKHNFNHMYHNKDMSHFKRNKKSQN